jgi:hypothetical protein
MGLNSDSNYFAIDYMLETIFHFYSLGRLPALQENNNYIECGYLLFIFFFLRICLDLKNKLFFFNSENNSHTASQDADMQSAKNCKEFSETTRQLFDSNDKFYRWFAGIIDGDGNFDIRKHPTDKNKFVLKAIRIKLHNRDVRILTRIQNYLHMGRIRSDKNKPHSTYIVSTQSRPKEEMCFILNKLNGLIKIKYDSFKKALNLYEINPIEPNYTIYPMDPYFSGLIDTDGSIVFNFTGNRIECNFEIKYNEYSSKLNFDYVIPNYKPYVLQRTGFANKSSAIGKILYHSIAFKFQTVGGMMLLYDYVMENRLYSDMKFYRVSQIKKFIEIRKYKYSEFQSIEYKIYSDFLLN